MTSYNYNCIYYWDGGTKCGEWHQAISDAINNAVKDAETRKAVDALYNNTRKAGYYAVRGNTSIGAPEGPPAGLTDFLRSLRIGPAVVNGGL